MFLCSYPCFHFSENISDILAGRNCNYFNPRHAHVRLPSKSRDSLVNIQDPNLQSYTYMLSGDDAPDYIHVLIAADGKFAQVQTNLDPVFAWCVNVDHGKGDAWSIQVVKQ